MGNKTQIKTGSFVTKYEYNQFGNMTKQTDALNKSDIIQYDDYGILQSKTDRNGNVISYTYDGLGRLTEESESGGNKLVYAYDAQGNRKTMTVSGEESYTVTYTCDANNRLLEEFTQRGEIREYRRFSYDLNGNRLTKSFERFAPKGTETASVGFKKKTDVEMFESRMYNGFNRLISVFADNVNTTYAYRPDGLRHSKETFDYNNTQSTVHLWDGQNICAEQNASGVFARYLRGVNLIARRQDNLNQYYHFNAHGDVVQRTDYNGVVLKSYDYDAFGVEKNLEPMDANPWRYCGEYFDAETDTYYLRARYYSPITGRFLTEDALRFTTTKLPNGIEIIDPLSLNLYTYVYNNPIRFIDPSGHKRIDAEYTHKNWEVVGQKKIRGEYYDVYGMVNYDMTKVEFTNLNTILYTMDGQTFNTDPSALIKGKHLLMKDTESLIKVGKSGRNNNGKWTTGSLDKVTEMDTELGRRIALGIGHTAVSAVSDVSSGYVKAASETINSLWSGAETLDKLIYGQLKDTRQIGQEIVGYVPANVIPGNRVSPGTIKGLYEAYKNFTYKATFEEAQ